MYGINLISRSIGSNKANIVFADSYITITTEKKVNYKTNTVSTSVKNATQHGLLVTKGEMDKLGWMGGNTSISEIVDLNRCLLKYGITNKASITLFLATAMFETDYGRLHVENWSSSSEYEFGERGVGAVQTTHYNDHYKFIRDMGDYTELKGVSTADYINNNFSFWEIGTWEWIGKRLPGKEIMTGSGYDINSLIVELGINKNVFLASQLYVNNGVCQERNVRNIAINGESATTRRPNNWNSRVNPNGTRNDKTRLEMYDKAKANYYDGRR